MNEEEKKAIETLKEVASDDFDTLGDDISPKMAQNILNVIDKQQKEIKDWFEIADNILRATNDYGNISIGDIPKYIAKQQKEIEEKSTIIMAGAEKVKQLESQVEELLNVLDSEKKINYIKPIDIKPQKYISEDTIREKIEEIKTKKIGASTGIYAIQIDVLEELLEEN